MFGGERETNQAWLLVLVGGVTLTASFTPLCRRTPPGPGVTSDPN